MAKCKIIPVINDGQAKTNGIHEKALTTNVIDQLESGPQLLERTFHPYPLEMAGIIQNRIGGEIIKVPEKIAEWGMVVPEVLHE